MIGAPAGHCQIYLFDGKREDVQRRVNDFLKTQQDNEAVELAGVVYNYQGPEYDGLTPIKDSETCGIGLVFHYTIPTVTRRESPQYVPTAPVAPDCHVTPEMLFAVVQAANPPQEPTTRVGRAWQRFARRFL